MQRDPIEFAVTREIGALDRIMRHLNETDLLTCRLVSHFWNEAASFVLRRRSTMIKNMAEEQDLWGLEKCIERSLDFPFAGFKLISPGKWMGFLGAQQREFFQNYGARITRLRVDTAWLLMNFDLYFLCLYTKYLPRLSILEIDQPSRRLRWGEWNLFVTLPSSCNLKLASLQILRISSKCSEQHEDVLHHILTRASFPSLQIVCLNASPVLLGILQRAGKLGAVSFIKILEDEEENLGNRLQTERLEMYHLLSMESPSLTKLDFNDAGCLSLVGLWKILSSSQHTLKELHLAGDSIFQDSFWSSVALVFTKLTKLSLSLDIDDPMEYSLFGSSEGTSFPALKQVFIRLNYKRPNNTELPTLSSRVFIVPNVTSIELEGYVDEDGLHDLAQSFPNVKEMRLNYGYYSGQLMPGGRNPFEIWNVRKFKHLEKLIIRDFLVGRPTEGYVNMDSFLTGIPVEDCKRLYLKTIKRSLRANMSILELSEHLKELIVFVKPGRELEQPSENAPFISTVSVRYALEMIPNLRARFMYEQSSLQEGDTEMLEAAFKHVHGCGVELEPFFY